MFFHERSPSFELQTTAPYPCFSCFLNRDGVFYCIRRIAEPWPQNLYQQQDLPSLDLKRVTRTRSLSLLSFFSRFSFFLSIMKPLCALISLIQTLSLTLLLLARSNLGCIAQGSLACQDPRYHSLCPILTKLLFYLSKPASYYPSVTHVVPVLLWPGCNLVRPERSRLAMKLMSRGYLTRRETEGMLVRPCTFS